MVRLRLGIILFILSWIPFAQLFIAIAHNHNQLTSEHAADAFRLGVWTVQFIIGLIGIWLAGKVAIAEAKKEGWKKTPKKLWSLFLHGQ